RLVEQRVVSGQHAEVDQEPRVVVILDVLKGALAQRIRVVGRIVRETVEPEPHAEIVQAPVVRMRDGPSSVERSVLPCRVAVGLPDDAFRILQLLGALNEVYLAAVEEPPERARRTLVSYR